MSTNMSGGGVDYWTFFSEDAKRTGSLLYARIAFGVGQDEELKAIAALGRRGQPPANLLLGAVHFLLLRGAKHPLTRFYPSVGGTQDADTVNPYLDFRSFVLTHRQPIEQLVSTRVTNTNEIGRSAILHLGFRAVARVAQSPLALVEIGPSAGLNLNWDRYGVRYHQADRTIASINEGSPIVLDCELVGNKTPGLGSTPQIGSRIGLERDPVDLRNVDDRDWLRALMWPDQVSRLRRLERAIELFEPADSPIRAGDALALLPETLAEIDPAFMPCVYHTITIYQFSRDMKQALDAFLTLAGLRRPIFRLSFEYDGSLYTLASTCYHDGTQKTSVLASCHPHGSWLEWLA